MTGIRKGEFMVAKERQFTDLQLYFGRDGKLFEENICHL